MESAKPSLRQTGKVLESLVAGQKAVALFPEDVEVHNLGYRAS